MKVVDEKVLDRHRGPGVCEVCGKLVRSRDPHHIYARGFDSGGRIDLDINIVSACTVFSGGDDCHARIHNGLVQRPVLLEIVAKRENRTVESIQGEIWERLRTPKK